MTMLSPAEQAARLFEPRERRYANPGKLAAALDPAFRTSRALDEIDKALVELIDGTDHDALLILMPAQEGKSQKVSRRLPEWLLDHNPATRVAIISYELDVALRWGRDTKQDVIHADPGKLHIPIRRDSAAAGRWETPAGGGVYCVGIGGPLTGRPVDVLIVDDPVKDRAAAESARQRELAWQWWESVALTRLAPGGKCVMIMTRWHEDDLAGRILSRPSPLRWRVLSIPAIAGEDDPLGRVPGEELASVRERAPGHFTNLRATMSPYVFSGLYQQTPTAPEGNFYRRQSFRYWRAADPWPDGRERITLEGHLVTLADAWPFIVVDPAASVRTSADYTVAGCWAISVDGHLILLDRARGRVPDHDHFAMCEPLARRWGATQIYVEKSWWASTLIADAQAAGYPVAPLTADHDKLTRAIPAAGRLAAGRVWFPAEAEWLDEWCDELAAFPQGAHDDQADVMAYAARVASAEWIPQQSRPRTALSASDLAIAEAARSATGGAGDGTGELDAMNVPW